MPVVREDLDRTVVSVTTAELNSLLIQPAKDLGIIDYDPTRVSVVEDPAGGYIITFERVEVPA